MYKFTVVSRNATVYAENLDEVKKKILKVDNDFECVANVSFEEMTEVEK
mgnify:CR=1 FL=1